MRLFPGRILIQPQGFQRRLLLRCRSVSVIEIVMPTFFGSRFGAVVAAAVLLACGSLAQQVREQTVYTMRADYEIVAQSGGNGYVLRRLSKNGSAYETILLTRVSEKNGGIVYADCEWQEVHGSFRWPAGGEEVVSPGGEPSPQPASGQRAGASTFPADSSTTVPRTVSGSPVRLNNFTCSTGESPLRTGGLLLPRCGNRPSKGKRHRWWFRKLADRWYVRTSVSEDPQDAARFQAGGRWHDQRCYSWHGVCRK